MNIFIYISLYDIPEPEYVMKHDEHNFLAFWLKPNIYMPHYSQMLKYVHPFPTNTEDLYIIYWPDIHMRYLCMFSGGWSCFTRKKGIGLDEYSFGVLLKGGIQLLIFSL